MLLEIKTPDQLLATFTIARPRYGIEGDEQIISDFERFITEDSSLGSILMGLGIIRTEMTKEGDVVVFVNSDDDIAWPTNIREQDYPGQGG